MQFNSLSEKAVVPCIRSTGVCVRLYSGPIPNPLNQKWLGLGQASNGSDTPSVLHPPSPHSFSLKVLDTGNFPCAMLAAGIRLNGKAANPLDMKDCLLQSMRLESSRAICD